MPGPYRLIPGGRGMTELRRLAWSWPGAKFISLNEPRGIWGAVFTPSSPKKLLVLFAWRKGAGGRLDDALLIIPGVAAKLYMFLGNEGCIIGLCESWLSKLIFVFCYWFACIGFAIELMPAIAAELNCGVSMVCPGSMNRCWGAKEDSSSDCIGDAPTPKAKGIWLLTCIDWGI